MNVQDYGIKVRSEAIGMLKAGLAQKDVASRFQVSLRLIERRWRNEKLGKSQVGLGLVNRFSGTLKDFR